MPKNKIKTTFQLNMFNIAIYANFDVFQSLVFFLGQDMP